MTKLLSTLKAGIWNRGFLVPASCVLFVLLLFGGFFYLLGVTLKREVTPAEIVGLLVTIVIAFLIQNYFQKQFSVSRTEQDLLIQMARDIIHNANCFREVFVNRAGEEISPEVKVEILGMRQKLSISVWLLNRAMKKGEYLRPEKYERLRDRCINFIAIATDSPFPLQFPPTKELRKIEASYRDLVDELVEAIFDLNRC